MKENDFYYDQVNFTSANEDLLLEKGFFEFTDCIFDSLEMTEIIFSQKKFIDCTFKRCNLSNVQLGNAVFRNNIFRECRLMGLNWCAAHTFVNPAFYDSQLDYSVFLGLKLTQAIFEGSSLKDVDFSEADLTKSNFSKAMLEKASFNKANLSEADFRMAKGYLIDPRFTNVKRAKLSMPEALTLLRSLDIDIE